MTTQPVGTCLYTFAEVVRDIQTTGQLPTEAGLIRNLEDILSWGFEALELNLDLIFAPGQPFGKDLLSQVRQAVDRDGLGLTAHLPFINLGTTHHIEAARVAACAAILDAWRRVEDLPIHSAVLHLSGAMLLETPKPGTEAHDAIWKNARDQARRTLDDLLKVIPKNVLAIENLPDVPFDVAWPLVEEYDLGTCLDDGHALLRNADLWKFLDKTRNRILQIHLHDVQEFTDAEGNVRRVDHQELGTGILDVPRFAREVKDLPVTVILEIQNAWSEASLKVWRRAQAG